MSDSTAIIMIDSTSSDAENMQATVANSLVGDFAASMGPIATKCDTLAYKTNKIKDTISGMKPTNTSLLDELIANALNAAFQSSAWSMAGDAVTAINTMLNKCEYFKDAANAAGKYVDANKFIKSLAAAAAEKAEQAIDAIKEQFAGQGDFPELGIGKALSDIVSTGRAVYDKVEDALEDVADAISPIIEQGKNAINVMQTELAAAAKELGKLDKLINCLAALGGADYSDTIDGMINELECYYEKLGVFSDPNFANFGEFDVDNYLNTIGTLSPESAANIKKSINLYSKSKKNAEGAMAKAADLGIKTPSSLDPSAITDTITRKTQYAEENSKTSYEVPGIPGKTETKIVTMPTPDPVHAPIASAGEPPIPEEKIAYTTLVKETEVMLGPEVEDDYNELDPEHAQFNQYLSDAYIGISKVSIPEQTPLPNIKLMIALASAKFGAKNKNPLFGEKMWLLYITVGINVFLINIDSGDFVSHRSIISISNDEWIPDSQAHDIEIEKSLMFKAFSMAIKDVVFTNTEVQHTLS